VTDTGTPRAASEEAASPFRGAAVERVASPEQLDRMIRIVPPRRWLALVGVVLLLGATILWAVVATVPTTLNGIGYLLPEGGLRKVQAAAAGTVTSFDVDVGTHVIAEQVLGSTTDDAGLRTPILAPETGEVTEVSAVLHGHVEAGERLALVRPVGWPLVVYAYIPVRDAGALPEGAEVQARFGAGIAEAYGFARGRVASVSPFPATAERLAFILQDAALVDEVRALGPANEVVIELEQSAETPSGLVWGTGSGPPIALPAGLPATLVFVTGVRHPIEDVL